MRRKRHSAEEIVAKLRQAVVAGTGTRMNLRSAVFKARKVSLRVIFYPDIIVSRVPNVRCTPENDRIVSAFQNGAMGHLLPHALTAKSACLSPPDHCESVTDLAIAPQQIMRILSASKPEPRRKGWCRD
jgi:hypothetical protein